MRQVYERDESEAAKLDRNYAELLQELRVAETGVQILFAFLLAIAFQQRFEGLSTAERTVYLIALLSTAVATALLIAPVAAHRMLFRRRLKDDLVRWTSTLAAAGLVFLAMSVVSAVALIVDVAAGSVLAVAIVAALSLVYARFWCLLPWRWRQRAPVIDGQNSLRAAREDGAQAGDVRPGSRRQS